MFELFSDGPVYEYPQLVNITYSFLWAFILSSIIAITHRLTFTGDYYPRNFFQSLILGAIVTSMVMMAIGDSLARGLGVFGAMAIIRFRTRIDDPRDVLFLFAALSTGLAIGVFGFTTSFAGTVMFCLVAVLLHISPFRNFTHSQHLYFSLEASHQLKNVLPCIEKYCASHRQLSVQTTKENLIRYQFGIALRSGVDTQTFLEEIKSITGVQQIRLAVNEMRNND